MIYYELLIRRKYDNTYGTYDAYGISVCRGDSVIRVIEDISPDREKVAALAGLFNQERLSPSQLDEAIENFLYDFEV